MTPKVTPKMRLLLSQLEHPMFDEEFLASARRTLAIMEKRGLIRSVNSTGEPKDLAWELTDAGRIERKRTR